MIDLYMIFIYLDKTYNKIYYDGFQKINMHPLTILMFIKNIYDNVVINIYTIESVSGKFPINIRLHQKYTLSFYIFTLIMDKFISYLLDRPYYLLIILYQLMKA